MSFRGPEHSILINAAFWENTEIMSTENLDFNSKKEIEKTKSLPKLIF